MIKIDFEYTTKYGVYRDALHLPDDHGYTDAEIESLKQQRVDNWITVIETPPPETEASIPTTAETMEIAGETYQLLTTVPPSGAKLIEVSGNWYYRI